VGELEAYEHKPTTRPGLVAEYSGAATTADLEWDIPDGASEIVIRRMTVSNNQANRDSYPTNQDRGTEIYRGVDTTFTDTDLTKDVWYYYAAYAYHPKLGWSLPDTKAMDAVQAGVSNQNWLRGSAVQSSMQRHLYGARVSTEIYTR
jgi:hypothetical protein